ncbi:hypothetical protein [uncultured Nostoc sp.]|uniref:hypothetical protein n=1 Tax=uncultured Nostoc sp. TaxID=340711 RepID=UPI0035CA3E1F
MCGWTPENFLEESEPQLETVQKPKGRQCKGCLYRYIENKKLKSGAIASYPRVIGHREPSNPQHWRWGFNWEEKVDGEWKGRSIGNVPVGAIALIQSKPLKSLEDAIAEQHYTLELIPQLEAIYFCPDMKGLIVYRVTNNGGIKLADHTADGDFLEEKI